MVNHARSPNPHRTLKLVIASMALGACGEIADKRAGDLEWIRSRNYSDRYAYLTRSDLDDVFLFGAQVTATSNYPSNALNTVIRPLKVRLKLQDSADGSKELQVALADEQTPILSFDVGTYRGYYEIDFASAGNDIKLHQTVQVAGGQFTAMAASGYWLSHGQPRVLNVDQDQDTMVIDLEYHVQQGQISGNSVVPTSGVGDVQVRLYLRRQSANASLSGHRTIADGKHQHIGYFGANFMAKEEEERHTRIQRFSLADQIVFYLKDFPSKYLAVAKKAVLSWNQAFGYQAIAVRVAPASIDVGDPRYHVVKWFDGTDKNLGWAGVAKMIVDPDSGLVMSGSVYIQGDRLLKSYQDLVAFTHKSASTGSLTGSWGGASFSSDVGENPVLPFLTDADLSFDDYMAGYYEETIAHEIGHVLGLRHNFAGSTDLDTHGNSASVMDYMPRSERHKYHGPGHYDVAAIRWGYFGETPAGPLAFCTDEDVDKHYHCARGDYGHPVRFVVDGLADSMTFFSQTPVKAPSDSVFSPVVNLVASAHKLRKLRHQIPAASKYLVDLHLPSAYRSVFNQQVDTGLSPADQRACQHNLDRIAALAREKVTEITR